jgi:uncharacterized protein (DUF58 family)
VPAEELERSLRTLTACGRTTGLIHIVALDELATELRGPVELRDAESGRTVETTLDEEGAADYAARFASFADTVRERCREHGISYLRARSDEDALDLLLAHASDAAITVG